MAKTPRSPAADSGPNHSSWVTLSLVGITGMVIGATAMYVGLRSVPQPGPTAPAVAAAPGPSPESHLPAPELTAGLPPAQADRALGNFSYDHQNWPETIRYYESAIKQGSDDADIRTDLGNAYRFSRRPNDALAQYRHAQELNPAHEFSLFNQGALFLEDLNQPQQAVAVWTEYLRRFPQGRDTALAQQLIAQASGTASHAVTAGAPSPVAAPSQPATGPSSAEVEKLLRLVPANPPPAKP